MNAVERLLAHGEELLSLFDEMYRERIGSGRDPALPDVPQGITYFVHHFNEAVADGGDRWASGHWLQAAAETAWLEAEQAAGKRGQRAKAIGDRTAELFRDSLAKRNRLLSREQWRVIVTGVVSESRAWEPLASKVVFLAEKVCEAAKRVGSLNDDLEPSEWWTDRWEVESLKPLASKIVPAKRTILRQSLDLLYPYARPPAPTGSAAERKDSSEQRRIGRPVNDEQLARDLLEGWQAYEPEEGRKRVEDYLAQRADVRALKTEQAQRNRIAFLRTAYESARSYRRVKELAKESVRRRN